MQCCGAGADFLVGRSREPDLLGKQKRKRIALAICKHEGRSNYKDKYEKKIILLIIKFFRAQMKNLILRQIL